MGDFIYVKHSFNCGDLITIMPGLRQLYRKIGKKVFIYQRIDFGAEYYAGNTISTKNEEGGSVSMNKELFNRMKPLVESQEYIAGFKEWNGEEVDFDYDLTRDSRSIPMPAGLLHTWGEAVFPQTSCDLSEKWLSILKLNTDSYSDKIIVNRTERYNNPYISYFFLKKYQDRILFSGTKKEHEQFCNQFKLDIEYLKTHNFYELAQVIGACKFGVYNQSLHFHLADSMKTKRILELCAQFPNTFVTGANGHNAYKQQGLEYFFEKLINE